MSSAINQALYARFTGTEVLTGEFRDYQTQMAERLAANPKKDNKPAVVFSSFAETALYPCITFRPDAGTNDKRFSVSSSVRHPIYSSEVWSQSKDSSEITDIAELVDRLILSSLGAPPLPVAVGRIHLVETFVELIVLPDIARNAWVGLTRYKFVERRR